MISLIFPVVPDRIYCRFLFRALHKTVVRVPVYSRSEAATQLGVHPNTLLRYEELGLIEPERNPGNRYRRYDRADLAWIRCLQEMIHEDGYDRRTLSRMLDLNDCWAIRECEPSDVRRCEWARRLRSRE